MASENLLTLRCCGRSSSWHWRMTSCRCKSVQSATNCTIRSRTSCRKSRRGTTPQLLLQNLDLVITVDTSVAHLAGALGKPVWLMMHTEGSWHWMTERLDSPWYPSVRIFRQSKPHEWYSVIERISNELRSRNSNAEQLQMSDAGN